MSDFKLGYHTIIIGAGAAGLFCAYNLAQCGKSVLVLDHAKRIGEKIRISGGGRCNFTNKTVEARHFLSQNPHFARSALAQYTPDDFIKLIEANGIRYLEKEKGQLFTRDGAQYIVDLLLRLCQKNNVRIQHPFFIEEVSHNHDHFIVTSKNTSFTARHLIVATGGLSIPKIGASDLGYQIAKQFKHSVVEPVPALVPLTIHQNETSPFTSISGVSCAVRTSVEKQTFEDQMLFTHKGLSGPAILQISSYWQQRRRTDPNANIVLSLSDENTLSQWRAQFKTKNTLLTNALTTILPKRLAEAIGTYTKMNPPMSQLSNQQFESIKSLLIDYLFMPAGTQGYQKAEVTLGGVSCDELSSKTMESTKIQGLFFIGEVIDVTGHLGGYNFQWAWSSAYTAALALAQR